MVQLLQEWCLNARGGGVQVAVQVSDGIKVMGPYEGVGGGMFDVLSKGYHCDSAVHVGEGEGVLLRREEALLGGGNVGLLYKVLDFGVIVNVLWELTSSVDACAMDVDGGIADFKPHYLV